MSRGRPRAFDSDKALDAALMLFWRHGYEGTSLSMLTEAMGINMPSLYAAFGNKEALFRKALERYLQRPASYLPDACREPTARRVIQSLFRGAIHMVMLPRNPDGCLLVQGALAAGPGAEPIRHELARRRAMGEAILCHRFERAVKERDLPAQLHPATLARYIMTVIWGMSVQASGGANRKQLEEVAAMAMKSLRIDRKARPRRFDRRLTGAAPDAGKC